MNRSSYINRLARVREDLIKRQIDGVLLGSPANRRWLSGFTGSAGWLLITSHQAFLATDFRYWQQASLQAPEFDLHKIRKQMSESWKEFLDRAAVRRLGVEANFLSVQQKIELEETSEVVVVPLKETVEPGRAVKVKEEIALISQAAAITDRAMMEVPAMIQLGMSEKELAWKLERFLREEGAEALAFGVIVASGPNGAMAHHSPGVRQIEPGDWLIIDMGASIGGYNSDLTRTFIVGDDKDHQFERVYNLTRKAQEAALGGIRAGITGRAADALARDVIEEGGFGDEFGHSLGHGIGLEVHEDPRLSRTGQTFPLPAGSVVTVEPGIYIDGQGGVRIEDVVLVTDDGVEKLSNCLLAPIIPVG